MTYQFRALAEQAQADGHITAEEILGLRRDGWADGRIEPAEAEAIFVLNHRLATRDARWADFFVEAIGEFILAGGSPRGFVSETQADWLIAHLDRDGCVESMAELELLGWLFDRAEHVPERLKAYAIAQIEQVVLTGTGPTRDGGQIEAANVTDTECRLLRRFLFAFAGSGAAGVTQAEAELLFRLKDATLGAENSSEWELLFVQGVANYLMAYNSFEQLSPERAAQLDAFMNDTRSRVGGFFGRMAKSDLGENIVEAARRVRGFGRKDATDSRGAEAAAARKVSENENAWLQAQIEADRQFDPLEKALLRFIADEEGRQA